MEKIFETRVLVPYLTPFENFIVSLTCKHALCMRPKIVEIREESYRSKYLLTTDSRQEWLSGFRHGCISYDELYTPENYLGFEKEEHFEVVIICKNFQDLYAMRGINHSNIYIDDGISRLMLLPENGHFIIGDKESTKIHTDQLVCVRKEGVRISRKFLDYIINKESVATAYNLWLSHRSGNCIKLIYILSGSVGNALPTIYTENSLSIEISKDEDIFAAKSYLEFEDSDHYIVIPYSGTEFTICDYNFSTRHCTEEIHHRDKYIYRAFWNSHKLPYGGEYYISSIEVSRAGINITLTRSKMPDDRRFYIDIHKNLEVENHGDYYYAFTAHLRIMIIDIYAPKGLYKELVGEYYRYYILE